MAELLSKSSFRAPGAKRMASYLAEQIASGRLAEGAKLPAERQLSEQFQASRGTVRRVLQDMKRRGLISQAVGSGTFVLAGAATALQLPSGRTPADMSQQTSPAELMEARLLIEPLMAELIARHATTSDFSRMLECIAHAEAASTIEDFEHWDGELHRAFSVATHNTFFIQVLELMNQVREQGEWGRLKRLSLTPERRADYQRQHRTIVATLRDRDVEQARAALTGHLRQIQRNLFER